MHWHAFLVPEWGPRAPPWERMGFTENVRTCICITFGAQSFLSFSPGAPKGRTGFTENAETCMLIPFGAQDFLSFSRGAIAFSGVGTPGSSMGTHGCHENFETCTGIAFGARGILRFSPEAPFPFPERELRAPPWNHGFYSKN